MYQKRKNVWLFQGLYEKQRLCLATSRATRHVSLLSSNNTVAFVLPTNNSHTLCAFKQKERYLDETLLEFLTSKKWA